MRHGEEGENAARVRVRTLPRMECLRMEERKKREGRRERERWVVF